jgi:flagellar L-ring protein FlgH
MKGLKIIAVAMFLLGCLGTAADLMAQPVSLFADARASRPGDALTVVIEENASATNRTSTTTEKSNELGISSAIPGAGNLLDFIPLHSLDSEFDNQFEGRASTSRSANVRARITVNVVALKPNGDLIIEGVRTIKINGETEAIYLSGSISPSMVRTDNTVRSSSIADLQVEYTGKGTITQGTRPGVLVRFVNWIF